MTAGGSNGRAVASAENCSIAYAIATWELLQITEVITLIISLPDRVPEIIFVTHAVGFVPAMIFAWAYDRIPEGLKEDAGHKALICHSRNAGDPEVNRWPRLGSRSL